MNDSSLKTMLHDYVQGKLSGEESELVKKMLSNNPQIQKDLDEIKEYYNTLGLLSPITAPDDFLEKVHQKIELKENFFKKIISKRLIPAELAGLAISVILIIIVINPFKMDQAPTITYDEVKTPDINNYSVSKSIPKKTTTDTIELKPSSAKKGLSKSIIQRKSKPGSKAENPKLLIEMKQALKTIEDVSTQDEQEHTTELIAEDYELEESTTQNEAMQDMAPKISQPVIQKELIKDSAIIIYKDFDAGTSSKEDDKKEKRVKPSKKSKSKKRKKSQKIGDYLEPREEKVREIQEKLKELQEEKSKTAKESKPMTKGAPAYNSIDKKVEPASNEMKMMESSVQKSLKDLNADKDYNYDTVVKVDDTESLLKDDLSWMIRKNLNTYKNTVLMMDKSEKIFLITMDKKDYDSFAKWLKVKFNDQYTIKNSSIKKDKISFRLEF